MDDQVGHEHEYDEDDLDGEIVISIDPREGELDSLGVTIEEFEAALHTTLDAYDRAVEAADPDDVPALDDAEIILGGKAYPLSAVADINIASDLESTDDEDDGGLGPG